MAAPPASLPSVDPHSAVMSVLSRWQLAVEVHRSRLVKVLTAPVTDAAGVAPPAATAGGAAATVQRAAAVAPSTALPPTRAELDELRAFFGVAADAETAGGHAVLHQARRVLDQVAAAPLAAGLSTTARKDGGAPALPDAAAHRDVHAGWHMRRWHWLAARSSMRVCRRWLGRLRSICISVVGTCGQRCVSFVRGRCNQLDRLQR